MGWRQDVERYCRQCRDCSSFVRGRRLRRSGYFRQGTPAVLPSRGLTKMHVTELSATMGLRRWFMESTEGLRVFAYRRAPWRRGERLSLADLTTSGSIDKSGDGNRSTALHLGNGSGDDGPTVDVDGGMVHSTGDEYDNGGAGNVGEAAASESGSANTNGHLGYVVGRISPAGVETTRQINDRSSGSRRRVVVPRSMYHLVESTTTGPVTLMVPGSTGYMKTIVVWDWGYQNKGLFPPKPCLPIGQRGTLSPAHLAHTSHCHSNSDLAHPDLPGPLSVNLVL